MERKSRTLSVFTVWYVDVTDPSRVESPLTGVVARTPADAAESIARDFRIDKTPFRVVRAELETGHPGSMALRLARALRRAVPRSPLASLVLRRARYARRAYRIQGV